MLSDAQNITATNRKKFKISLFVAFCEKNNKKNKKYLLSPYPQHFLHGNLKTKLKIDALSLSISTAFEDIFNNKI